MIIFQVSIKKVILTKKEENLYKLLNNKKIKCYLQKKFLEFLLSQVYIIVIIKEENFYDNMLETLTSVIC